MKLFFQFIFTLLVIASLFLTTAKAKEEIVAIVHSIQNEEQANNEFSSIQAALNAAPSDQKVPYKVFIKNGSYHEKIIISRPNVTLIGEDEAKTIIDYPLAAGMIDAKGDKVGTSGSAIFIIKASNVRVQNLTIRNSFDFNANQVLAEQDPNKLKDTQAVAVLIEKNSDKIRFNHTTLESYQDTLYLKDKTRSYFTHSTISGHVDFIFGGGTAVFDECTLIARNRNDVNGVYGYLTAPSTPISEPYGLIIMNSKLVKEEGVPANSFALGRPWHPTTQFKDGRYADPNAIGMALFINNQMDDHLFGWDKMSGKDKNGAVIYFYPEQSRFMEYKNEQTPQKRESDLYSLSQEQAKLYTVDQIFSDWPAHLIQK